MYKDEALFLLKGGKEGILEWNRQAASGKDGSIRLLVALVLHVQAGRVEGGLLHGGRHRMGDGVADEDDSLAHARTLSRSEKNVGYETAALAEPWMAVVPEATRPATANVMTRR